MQFVLRFLWTRADQEKGPLSSFAFSFLLHLPFISLCIKLVSSLFLLLVMFLFLLFLIWIFVYILSFPLSLSSPILPLFSEIPSHEIGSKRMDLQGSFIKIPIPT